MQSQNSDSLENMVEWRPQERDPRVVIWTAPHAPVMIQNIEPGDLAAQEAREIATALNEAATYSDGRQGRSVESKKDEPHQIAAGEVSKSLREGQQ